MDTTPHPHKIYRSAVRDPLDELYHTTNHVVPDPFNEESVFPDDLTMAKLIQLYCDAIPHTSFLMRVLKTKEFLATCKRIEDRTSLLVFQLKADPFLLAAFARLANANATPHRARLLEIVEVSKRR